MTEKTDGELADLARTHRLAAEEYERQLAALRAIREPELPKMRADLSVAYARIAELESILDDAMAALNKYG